MLASCSTPAPAATPAHPIVVELFQSQGCSSCPPANANLVAIAGRPDVLALSFAVTYWDRLGWRDTFGDLAFNRRQREYAAAGRGLVATPQMIVNGRFVLNGGNRQQVEAALRRAATRGSEPAITAARNVVTVGQGNARRNATVWLVRYDPRVRNVAISAGENGGRTLPHRNVVRMLRELGGWNGSPATFRLPASGDPALRTAILVQDGPGGSILAASRL